MYIFWITADGTLSYLERFNGGEIPAPKTAQAVFVFGSKKEAVREYHEYDTDNMWDYYRLSEIYG